MEEDLLHVIVDGKEETYTRGTKMIELARAHQENYKDDIVLASQNNRLCELNKKVKNQARIHFLTTADDAGKKAYRRSVTLLMQKAVYNILGKGRSRVRVLNAISQGYYCELTEDVEIDATRIADIKGDMLRMVKEQLPIEKKSLNTDEAVELFCDLGMKDKERLFRYRRSSRVNIYSLDGYLDYFYGYMVPDTSYLKYFDIIPFENGFVLLFPHKETKEVAEFTPSKKHFETLCKSREWAKTMGIDTIGALNDVIAEGRMREIILTQEALMERRIGELAEMITASGEKKFVMIAGPSSSGKTTFSNRLSIQLSALGLNPHPFSLDDYYINRDLTPKDEDGNFDFECLEALDVELFNKDMTTLLKGEKVSMPTFNFKTGKREYKGNELQLGKKDILVIEGIHGLNDKLSYTLPDESKFRIFISALTQLNIDEHNYLPTTDGRLLRRIVRDARTRNTSAQETIAMWYSVRRGEEKNIFPFQDSADVMFNSALIYELAVLKSYAEPLLFHIDKDAPEYTEAKRLLKFLDYFLPVPSEQIESNSILREFIGGSCFHV